MRGKLQGLDAPNGEILQQSYDETVRLLQPGQTVNVDDPLEDTLKEGLICH